MSTESNHRRSWRSGFSWGLLWSAVVNLAWGVFLAGAVRPTNWWVALAPATLMVVLIVWAFFVSASIHPAGEWRRGPTDA